MKTHTLCHMNPNVLLFSSPISFSTISTLTFPRILQSRLPVVRQATRGCAAQSSSSEAKLAASTTLFRYNSPHITQQNVQVLLVKRGKQPNKHLWALPGGSANSDEPLLATASRELHEETRFPLDHVMYFPNPFLHRFIPVPNTNVYYHIHVFCAFTNDCSTRPIASDDAADAQFFKIDQINTLETVCSLHSVVCKALDVLKTRSPKSII